MRSLIALLLTTTSALAEMPPPQYDYPYVGKKELHLVPYGMAGPACRRLNPYDQTVPDRKNGRYVLGCQFWRVDVCVIVYSHKKSEPEMRSNVLRHEMAHCNGWKH